MMTNSRYVVTAVDYGDSCDGHPRCLGIFRSWEEAKTYVQNDMEDRCDQLAGADIQADFSKMEIVNESCDLICAWSIETCEVP